MVRRPAVPFYGLSSGIDWPPDTGPQYSALLDIYPPPIFGPTCIGRCYVFTRVVTLNVCGVPRVGNLEARIATICALLNTMQIDVLCLQEVHTWKGFEQFRELLT